MTDRQDTGGLATVLALLGVGAAQDAGGDAGQQDFFEAEAPMPLEPKGVSGPQGGRPANARNKSTEEWRRYFLSQNRSPMSILGTIAGRDVGELTDYLQEIANRHRRLRTVIGEDGKTRTEEQKVLVSPLDVLRLQRDAAVALMPYLHKKQPVAIEVDQRQRGVVLLGGLTGAVDVGDDLALPLPPERDEEVEQPQQVAHDASQSTSSVADAKSDGKKSDDQANGLIFRDE